MAERTKALVVVLVLIIVVLAGVLAFTFLIKPKVTGYVVEKQNEGIQIAVTQILMQLQQQGYVQIPLGVDESGQQQALTLITPQQCSALQQPQVQ